MLSSATSRLLTNAYTMYGRWKAGKWERGWLAGQHAQGRCMAYTTDDKSAFVST